MSPSGVSTQTLIVTVSAWDEIHEVFGDGHEYDWALVEDDEPTYEEQAKQEMKYQDVRHLSDSAGSILIGVSRFSSLQRSEPVY